MMSLCDAVEERLALAEPLAELHGHVDDCPRCQGLLAVQHALARTSSGVHAAEPAQGFTSRMTVLANQRLVTRHRRRVVGYAAISAMAAALTTFAVVRDPSKANPQAIALPAPSPDAPNEDLAAKNPIAENPWQSDTPDPALLVERDNDEVRALYRLSKTHSARLSANWTEIERPLQPYRRLLRQVAHR
jgi:hypothetical protein